MPIDRDVALKAAEAHLRLGKLDLAIGEYRHVLLADPTDHETALRLADLYLRTGHRDRAVDLMRSAAEILVHKQMLADAAAVYRRLLVARQDDEDALLKAADIARALGRTGDAEAYLNAAADWRAARGDMEGAARLRSQAAAAVAAPAESTAESDARVRAHLARTYIAMGDAEHAAEYLTADVAGDDAKLLMTVAEIQLRGGQDDEALATLERVATLRPSLASDIAKLALEAARHTAPDVAFTLTSITVPVGSANAPPTADFASPTRPLFETTVGVPVQFNPTGTFDPEGAWGGTWDFGDGQTHSGTFGVFSSFVTSSRSARRKTSVASPGATQCPSNACARRRSSCIAWSMVN